MDLTPEDDDLLSYFLSADVAAEQMPQSRASAADAGSTSSPARASNEQFTFGQQQMPHGQERAFGGQSSSASSPGGSESMSAFQQMQNAFHSAESSMLRPVDDDAASGTGGLDSDEKRQRRLARNRESARQSRRRKKQYLELLEEKRADESLNNVRSEILATLAEDLKNSSEEERLAVKDYNFRQLDNLLLPPYCRFLLWLSIQDEAFFDEANALGAKNGPGDVPEKKKAPVMVKKDTLWSTLTGDLALTYEQDEKLKSLYKSGDSKSSKSERRRVALAVTYLSKLKKSLEQRSETVQRHTEMLHSILTPEQSLTYLRWVDANQDRLPNYVDKTLSMTNTGASEAVRSILKKDDRDLTVEDVTALLGELPHKRSRRLAHAPKMEEEDLVNALAATDDVAALSTVTGGSDQRLACLSVKAVEYRDSTAVDTESKTRELHAVPEAVGIEFVPPSDGAKFTDNDSGQNSLALATPVLSSLKKGEVPSSGRRRLDVTLLLSLVFVVVVCVCLAWTLWLMVLTAAPNDTVNSIMRTEAFDNGSFWLLINPPQTLLVLALLGLSIVGLGYISILIKLARRPKPTDCVRGPELWILSFDLLIAVGYPMLVLIYCLSTFHFDRAKLAINLAVFPPGSFEQGASVIADPVQTVIIYKSLKSLRIVSVLDFFTRVGVNLALCFQMSHVVGLIQDPRARQTSVYPKKHRASAAFFVVFAILLCVFVGESVRTSARACEPHPECVVNARRWTNLKRGSLTQCPCLMLIDEDDAPKTFEEVT
ncbi:hypothetical protein BBJ28_00009594 [Nothophytophthora sp. Chile5]|nr:hypothetical protein BBJ28_00009594 [Nothophytophthora sp. Chile5]